MINYELKEPTITVSSQPKRHGTAKVAMDVHGHFHVCCLQEEGQVIKHPQKFSLKDQLRYMKGLAAKYTKVYSCYEAGPTGFALHRQLTALGIENVVVAPTCLDERSKGVNNDYTDTRALSSKLDRYVAGDPKAFTVVRVPTELEEHRRNWSRLYLQFQKCRLRTASQGRTLALTHALNISNDWWKESKWEKHQKELPSGVADLLGNYRQIILPIDQQMKAVTDQITAIAGERALEYAEVEKIRRAEKARTEREQTGAITNEAAAPPEEMKIGSIPKWMGVKTMELIDAEVCCWERFSSARKASSYTGMVGGVASSGERRADLSITKAGNGRLRRALVEAAWRMALNQPGYWLTKKLSGALGLGTRTHARVKKKMIVAYARQLFVDLWKWRTGRIEASELGWTMT